jgi:predicted metal-dependent peptidase
MADQPFNLNMHTARLLLREPFFAALSRRIDKTASTAIPTAGVRVNPERGQFEMIYNPEFMAALSDTHKLGVLMHEFYHIIFEHVTGRKPADGLKRIDNIAMDLAINGLPEMVGKLPCESGILKLSRRWERAKAAKVENLANPAKASPEILAMVILSVVLTPSTLTMNSERLTVQSRRSPKSA